MVRSTTGLSVSRGLHPGTAKSYEGKTGPSSAKKIRKLEEDCATSPAMGWGPEPKKLGPTVHSNGRKEARLNQVYPRLSRHSHRAAKWRRPTY